MLVFLLWLGVGGQSCSNFWGSIVLKPQGHVMYSLTGDLVDQNLNIDLT